MHAGQKYGIPWNVLAAVGKVETDHGRPRIPGVHDGVNPAGAAGPMQFLRSTWETYGIDGNNDGRRNIYDAADAIPAAARYLKDHGAPGRLRHALFAYNHSTDYVQTVLGWANKYAEGDTQAALANPACAALAFADLPSGTVGEIIAYARAQLGKPYPWGAEGPDAFDCSGLVMMAYRAAGLTIPRTTYQQWRYGQRIPADHEQPGDLVFFNPRPDGPGHVGPRHRQRTNDRSSTDGRPRQDQHLS